MNLLNKIGGICRAFLPRRRDEHELDAEVAFDLEARAHAHRLEGLSAAEARLAALREFGSVELAKDECRDERRTRLLEQTWQDVRFGFRTMRKNAGFTAVAILTLALGIGANASIFSVVNAVVLQPLPFPNSNRLVMIWGTDLDRGRMTDVTSYLNFLDWKNQSRSFDNMGAFVTRGMTLSEADGAALLNGLYVSPGFFETLGVYPAVGRTFRAGEEDPGVPQVAILSDAFWKQHFAGRSDILGQTLRITYSPTVRSERAYTIIGVMPASFRVIASAQEDVYLPLPVDPNRGHGFLRVIGRLKSGVTISQAHAEMDVIARQLEKQYPKYLRDSGANVMPLVTALVGDVRAGLFIFMGVVAVVLLIACTNVAHLMLSRGASRQRELAVRVAVGAGRSRLVRQLLTESTLIALLGGVCGLLLVTWTTPLLVAMLARNFSVPRLASTHTDISVLGFTLAISLVTGVLFGIIPALVAVSPNLNEDLRESSRSATSGKGGGRAQNALVIAETALALVLLSCAGLLLRALWEMRTTAPGFDGTDLAVVDYFVPQTAFRTDAQRIDFYTRVLQKVSAVPSVRSAALVADLPLGGGSDSMEFHIAGKADPAPGKGFESRFNIVSAGYFRAMGIPIRSGREFTADDQINTPGYVVINEAAARNFWPGESAIGQRIQLDKFALSVIGIAGDVKSSGLDIPTAPEIYLDYAQNAPGWSWLVLVARTAGDTSAAAPLIRAAAASVDNRIPAVQVRTMDEVLSRAIAQPRVFATLLGVFAFLALTLAGVGLYGVVSHSVAQRIHEIGVRMALGAGRGEVMTLMLRRALGMVLAGVAIGLAGAAFAGQLLKHLVRSVDHADPLTLAVVAIALLLVAFIAAYVPARRAMRVDPVAALRCE